MAGMVDILDMVVIIMDMVVTDIRVMADIMVDIDLDMDMVEKDLDTGDDKMRIGFLGLLTLIFVVAKIVGALTWSWFWVLSPMIFGVGLVVFLIILTIIVGILLDQ